MDEISEGNAFSWNGPKKMKKVKGVLRIRRET